MRHIGTEHDSIFTDQLERLAQVLVFFAARSAKSGDPLFSDLKDEIQIK
jgi:hypothetical protein